MNDLMEDVLRFLAWNPNLGLLASAFLTSTAVVLVAWAVTLQLQSRSARARSLVWRIAVAALLVVAAWRLMPEAAPPVAVMEWRVQVHAVPSVEGPASGDLPALILPEKSAWQNALSWLESAGIRLWLGAAAVLLCWRLCTSLAGMIWLRKHSEPAPEPVLRLLRELNAPVRLGCRMAQRLQSPMLSGWWRPVIWLPPEVSAWDDKRLLAVLRHELAHLQRADVAFHWLAQLTVCLWWWQPLAWRAWRSLRSETEHAADDAAVLAGGNTHEYARTLVEIAAGLPSRPSQMPGVTMFGGESVQRRVRELMKASQWRGRIGMGAMGLIAVVAVLLAVLAATKVEFKPKAPVYLSEAKLVAPGLDDKTENGQDWRADFYGTITETLESGEMKRHALERLRALYPDLKDKDVEIHASLHASQIKGPPQFDVQALSADRKYAQVFLDALLDEFIAFRQSVRERSGGTDMQKLSQEAVKAQKVMEVRLAELAEFKQSNNIMVLTNGNNEGAQFLAKMHSQLEELQTQLSEQEVALRDIPSAMTIAQTRVSEARPLTMTEKDYVQTQSELRRCENELKYLLETHKPDHPLVTDAQEKAAKVRFLLNALIDPLREEMNQRTQDIQRRMTVLKTQLAEKQKEALYLGEKIAQHDKLERQAKAAKETYEKLFDQVKHSPAPAPGRDFVAIQQRAQPATEVQQSGLLPVWKLWKSETKQPAEENTPKPAPKKKEPAKAEG
ncbi:M56 family metallopeptidase [Prosthecobacter sp.]|uniref:M56 family metallopeptidase n=1 Tax=Prosthecobacter sp. TaxID=1965333 RepID=UPI00378458A0